MLNYFYNHLNKLLIYLKLLFFFSYRVEVSKLLGKVEMLSVPYVTENTRVHVLLPVRVNEKKDALNFLKQYKQICIDKKEKTMLMLVCRNCYSESNLILY